MEMKICCSCKKELEKSPEFFNWSNKERGIFNKQCKECRRKHYLKHKDKKLKYQKEYVKNNKDKIKKYKKEYYKLNKSYKKYSINKEKRKEYIKNWMKNKRLVDINFSLNEKIRHRISEALKNNYKSFSTNKLLGCSISQLKIHLESKFYNNQETSEVMSWSNYGFYGWHIDHIIPCSKFNMQCPLQQMVCFHYTNLQPLWAKDNLKKGNKILK